MNNNNPGWEGKPPHLSWVTIIVITPHHEEGRFAPAICRAPWSPQLRWPAATILTGALSRFEKKKDQKKHSLVSFFFWSGYVWVCWYLSKYITILSQYVRICQNMSEYVRICQNMSAYIRICQNMSEYVRIEYIKNTAKYAQIHQNTSIYSKICQIAWEHPKIRWPGGLQLQWPLRSAYETLQAVPVHVALFVFFIFRLYSYTLSFFFWRKK